MKKISLLLGLSLMGAFGAGAAVLPAEKLLPSDTLVLFSIPDFAKMRDIYRDSAQGRLWRDPAMKPFTDKFMNQFQSQLITPLEHDMGVHLSDYTNFLQ